MQSLRILLTNLNFRGYAGTQVVTRDLALAFQTEGHQPFVYSPYIGGISDELVAAGIPVVDNLENPSFVPDIIHGHHHIETLQALWRFPKVPAIFVCHARIGWHSAPPLVSRIRRFVAVDYYCRERLIEEHHIAPDLIRVIFNGVDLEKFQPRAPLPNKPQRALVFSNSAMPGTYLDAIREACGKLNISLDIVGDMNGNVSQPEEILGRYDLVFGKARCALEAMAVGASVVLCDWRGLGSMVTAAEFDHLREWNFGMRLLQRSPSVEAIIQEIERYDPSDAAAVSQFIRQRSDFKHCVQQYLDLYREVLDDIAPAKSFLEEVRDYAANLTKRIEDDETQLAAFKQKPDFMHWESMTVHTLRAEEAKLRQHLSNQDAHISDLTTYNRSLQSHIKNLETHVQQLQAHAKQVEAYANQIAIDLNNQQTQTKQIQEADSQVQTALHRLEGQHHQLELDLQQAKAKAESFDTIQKSRIFRFVLQPIWRLRQILLPEGSVVYKAYHRLLSVFRKLGARST